MWFRIGNAAPRAFSGWAEQGLDLLAAKLEQGGASAIDFRPPLGVKREVRLNKNVVHNQGLIGKQPPNSIIYGLVDLQDAVTNESSVVRRRSHQDIDRLLDEPIQDPVRTVAVTFNPDQLAWALRTAETRGISFDQVVNAAMGVFLHPLKGIASRPWHYVPRMVSLREDTSHDIVAMRDALGVKQPGHVLGLAVATASSEYAMTRAQELGLSDAGTGRSI